MMWLRRLYASARAWCRAFGDLCAFLVPRPVEMPPDGGWWVIGPSGAPSHNVIENDVPASAGAGGDAMPMKRKGPKRIKKRPQVKGKSRSAVTGRYVTREKARRSPRTTVTERD